MPVTCAFDNSVHEDTAALHAHLRRFRIKQEVYYHEYHPRRDRLTGELLPYQDYDQYHSAEFANKVSLRKWLAKEPEEGMKWATQWLATRKYVKCLTYAPSQAELRTLLCPSMPYYDKLWSQLGGYYGVTRGIGFTDRYCSLPLVFTPLPANASVIQDTREQTPLKLSLPCTARTLGVGDYALAEPYDRGVRIERKSLSDFCGTLSGRKVKTKGRAVDSPLDRFKREMDRAVEGNIYVVMMVESTIADAQRFNYLPHTRHIKASPQYIMHNMRNLLVSYPLHLQVLFTDGRVAMAEKLVKVFELGDQVKTTDLQYQLELGNL